MIVWILLATCLPSPTIESPNRVYMTTQELLQGGVFHNEKACLTMIETDKRRTRTNHWADDSCLYMCVKGVK